MDDAIPSLPRIRPVADQAVLVEFGDVICAGLNERVTRLARLLRAEPPAGVLAIVPTYRSVLVEYDPLVTRAGELGAQLRRLAADTTEAPARARRWRIPVVYGGAYGADLEDVARLHGLTPDEAAAIHAAGRYRVFMIGFMPGLAYLGGLDARLHTPRRHTPRARTPAGSVNIGGAQTLISSVEAPSGWHLLGRTPVRAFDPARPEPFLFMQGDEILFEPVDEPRYLALSEEAGQPGWMPEWEWVQ